MKNKRITVFDVCNTIFMAFVCFITLYPVWYCVIVAFNNGQDTFLGNLYFWPRMFTFDNFKAVFKDSSIIGAFTVSIARTLIATAAHVLFTAIVAYALSKKELKGRKIYLGMGIVTLFFSGGLIPTFLLVRSLGLYNNFFVYVLLPMFNFYDAVIFMNFFKSIPVSLEESAKIDGARPFYIFFKLIIPLSGAVFATITLFNGVFNWNDYFMGVIYTSSPNLQPIQSFLYKIITLSSADRMVMDSPGVSASKSVTSASVKMATMVITTAPIVCVYPFLQRYFVKGIMLGSVKE